MGWEDEYIISILETLKKENVHITFNVTGKWAENKKDLLLRIKNEGHEIGNHGYKHLDYANLSYDENYQQISTSKKIMCINTGEVFGSIREAEREYDIPHQNIIACCKGRCKSAGKHPITGEKLVWKYV